MFVQLLVRAGRIVSLPDARNPLSTFAAVKFDLFESATTRRCTKAKLVQSSDQLVVISATERVLCCNSQQTSLASDQPHTKKKDLLTSVTLVVYIVTDTVVSHVVGILFDLTTKRTHQQRVSNSMQRTILHRRIYLGRTLVL